MALVEGGGENEAQIDPVEMVTQLREKIDGKKKEIENLSTEEAKLRDEISQLSAQWREEKMQLTRSANAAEKKSKAVSGSGAEVLARRKIPPSIQRADSGLIRYSAKEKNEIEQKMEKEKKMQMVADERKKRLEKEEQGLLADVARLKAELQSNCAKNDSEVVPENNFANVSPKESSKNNNKRYTQLGGVCFFEDDICNAESVSYLTAKLDQLICNFEVSFSDLFSLKKLIESSDGRRIFCQRLMNVVGEKNNSNSNLNSNLNSKSKEKSVENSREKYVEISSDAFDHILWLFSTVLSSFSADSKPDFFSLIVLAKCAVRIVRQVNG